MIIQAIYTTLTFFIDSLKYNCKIIHLPMQSSYLITRYYIFQGYLYRHCQIAIAFTWYFRCYLHWLTSYRCISVILSHWQFSQMQSRILLIYMFLMCEVNTKRFLHESSDIGLHSVSWTLKYGHKLHKPHLYMMISIIHQWNSSCCICA